MVDQTITDQTAIDILAATDGLLVDDASDFGITKKCTPAQISTYVGTDNLSNLASTTTSRTNLGVSIGTDVQAYDADLAAIAGLTSSADKLPYFTGSGTASTADFTAAGRALVDDVDAAAQRTTLGLGTIATQAATSVDIDGGAIDGTTIGGTTPAAATVTDLVADTITVNAGTGSGTYVPSGAINLNTTEVGNVGVGEDDLITYTLPANSLSTTGKAVRVTVWGSGANNVNAKTIKFHTGATVVKTISLLTSNVQDWEFIVYIMSTGANTQDYYSNFHRQAASGVDVVSRDTGTLTLTNSSTIVIKCTGEATADNDIIQKGMLVEYLG